MPPEDEFAFERLSEAEKIIKALETIAKESEGRGLDPFVKRIRECIKRCQADYVSLHRAIYSASVKPPKVPPGKRH